MSRLLRGLVMLLVLGGAGLPAYASDLVRDVGTRLQQPELLRGQFEQRKVVKGFTRPLRSRGDFLFWQEHGVIWHTRAPFEASLILTPRALASRQNNQTLQRLDAQKEPGLRALNETLMALLSGNLTSLQQRFDITGTVIGTAAWQLRLTPRDARLAGIIQRIELSGDAHVREVNMLERNGDTSHIRFDRLSTSPAASRQEAGWLNE